MVNFLGRPALSVLATAILLSASLLATPAQADDGGDGSPEQDDSMCCRFFAADIIGNPQHVEEVTGVPGYYWYSDAEWDYYIFYWRFHEAGVVLRFYPNGGDLSVMKGTIGFEPGVRYWECNRGVAPKAE